MKIYRLYGLNSGEYCQWCRDLWGEDRSKWSWELSNQPRNKDPYDQIQTSTFVILKIHEKKDALLFDTTFKSFGEHYEELCSTCHLNGKFTVV